MSPGLDVTGGWRGPGWQVAAAEPRCCGLVRRSVTSAIAGHDCRVDLDDAAVCVTELFANAVVHGPPGGLVLAGYVLWREGARLVVCDAGGAGTPRLVASGERAEGGRGLHVVNSLAAQWGQFRLPAAQVAWCDLGGPLPAAGGDAWAWLHPVLAMRSLSAPATRTTAAVPALAAAGPR